MYDVAIIGAGPAGATLARLIGGCCRVLLLDKRGLTGRRPAGPGKCCGGLVAPDGQKMLAAMGMGLPARVLVGPQLFAVRCIDLDHGLVRYYQRHYMNIDRGRLDEWLFWLAAREVQAKDRCLFKSFQEDGDALEITFTHKGKRCTERARLLVGADGANSLVRRQAEAAWPGRVNPMPRKYVAIQEWFEASHPQPWYSVVFDREVTDFYSWLIPKDGSLIVGSALPPGGAPARRFELLKDKLRDYGIKLGRRIRRCGALLHRPQSVRNIAAGTGRVMLVGEAAGLISPSSAEGLSYAFRSAMILGELLRAGPDSLEKRYRARMKPLKRNILLKNLKCHVMYDGPVRRFVLRTGLRAIRIGGT